MSFFFLKSNPIQFWTRNWNKDDLADYLHSGFRVSNKNLEAGTSLKGDKIFGSSLYCHTLSFHWTFKVLSQIAYVFKILVSKLNWILGKFIWLLNNKSHGLSPSGGHHSILFDQVFPNNAQLQRHLANQNAIWWYFVSMRLYLADRLSISLSVWIPRFPPQLSTPSNNVSANTGWSDCS